jgi:hypothetical protein
MFCHARHRVTALMHATYTPRVLTGAPPLKTWLSFPVLCLLLWGCAVLPSPPGAAAPFTRAVVCISRTLSGGPYLRVLHHRFEIANPTLIAFLDAHPRLDGRLSLSDLLFIEGLAESRCGGLLATPTDVLHDEVQHRLEASASGWIAAASTPGSTSHDALAGLDPVDLCKVSLVLDALQDDAFIASVAESIEADALDRSSEHGGLALIAEGDSCAVRLLEIRSAAGGDHDYVLPAALFTAGCLAFWHDHAFNDLGLPVEELDNRGAVMPSGSITGSLATVWGDRWVAYVRGIDGLIFTPTGGKTFAVVYFTSEGATVDLGRYPSPKSP